MSNKITPISLNIEELLMDENIKTMFAKTVSVTALGDSNAMIAIIDKASKTPGMSVINVAFANDDTKSITIDFGIYMMK